MIRFLPLFIELMLLVFCLIDLAQSDERDIRALPRWGWVLLIIFLPLVGGIAWLIAGRPLQGARSRGGWAGSGYPQSQGSGRAPMGPDDDPEFLAQLRKSNQDHEQMLDLWEQDLKRRERQLRPDEDDRPPER